MRIQLKGLKKKDIIEVYNSVSKIVYNIDSGREFNSLATRGVDYGYKINDFLLANPELNKNYVEQVIYRNDLHSIVAHVYDTTKNPEECEIMTKEDDVLFEDESGVDFIFIPRQLITNESIDNVYTAAFVMLHLTFNLILGNTYTDSNLSALSSLLACTIVSDGIFYSESNPLGIYKNITKDTVDNILSDSLIRYSTDSGSYIGNVSDNTKLFKLINIYLHNANMLTNALDKKK